MANEAETGFVKALLVHQERMMRLLGIPVDRQKYLTGNWVGVVAPPPMLTGGFPLTSWSVADASRYPHTCPRCQGPAYVGAVEVDCAGGCK